jgi:hypothetical protein
VVSRKQLKQDLDYWKKLATERKDKVEAVRQQVVERQDRIEALGQERDNAVHNLNEFVGDLAAAKKERDDLRRQLAQIREANESLQEAIHPDLLSRAIKQHPPVASGSIGVASTTGIMTNAADVFPQHEKGLERC